MKFKIQCNACTVYTGINPLRKFEFLPRNIQTWTCMADCLIFLTIPSTYTNIVVSTCIKLVNCTFQSHIDIFRVVNQAMKSFEDQCCCFFGVFTPDKYYLLNPQPASLTPKVPSCEADCMAKLAEGNHSNVKCFIKFLLRNSTRFIKKQKLFISSTLIVNEFFFQSQKNQWFG